MNVYIYFNQEHNVLICKVHQYAVSFKFLVHHFLQKHDLDIKICQGIVNYASQFTTMEPGHLLYSSEKVIPVLYLDIVDVFQCKYDACNKILGTLISIKDHCKIDHDWKAKDRQKWAEIRVQIFFQGHDKRYVN